MAAAASGGSSVANVRVVVVGDAGTGKSSLIVAAAAETFPDKAPPVLPPTILPPDFYPDRVPLTIIDTSSRPEDRSIVEQECKKADTVVLTYSCDKPESLARLQSYWLPELRNLGVKLPIIVVGCKLDQRDERQPSLEQVMAPIMHEFREIETCIECSALKQIQVTEVFYYAQKAVLHPTAPLFDQESQNLKPRCIRALKRIFILCDQDRDGALNDAELNDFQVKCFQAPLQPSEIVGVKKVVAEKLPDGVSENGLTLTGFLFLHALFIERGRLETTWTVLRKFGYDDEIKLREELLQNPSFKRAPDQSVELTERCLDFLRGVFAAFDMDGDGSLKPQELEELFSTAPSSPWEDDMSEVEVNAMGGVTLNGFLSQWSLMTLLDPVKSLAHLIYIGYPVDPSTAFRITRRRRQDRKKQRSQRNVFQCFVFGPTNAGKSALLNAHIGRPFSDAYEHTANSRYAANVVEQTRGTKKTLCMREIPEEMVATLLHSKDPHALAQCDVAAFVYDSSDEASWKRAAEILVEVAAYGENYGYEVPCLLIAAKDDQEPDPVAIQNSARVCTDMGIEAPIAVSMKLGDIGNLFRRIVDAAERPHLSIPETEAGKSYKSFHRFINRSLTVTAVGAAVVFVAIAAYRTYEYKRKSSTS